MNTYLTIYVQTRSPAYLRFTSQALNTNINCEYWLHIVIVTSHLNVVELQKKNMCFPFLGC